MTHFLFATITGLSVILQPVPQLPGPWRPPPHRPVPIPRRVPVPVPVPIPTPPQIPVIGRGPGFKVYSAWGDGFNVETISYGTRVPMTGRRFGRPLVMMAVIYARSWEDATEIAGEYFDEDN